MPPNVDDVVEVEGFSEVNKQIFEALDRLGNRVLEALAVYLQQPRDYFADKTNEGRAELDTMEAAFALED